MQASRLHVAIVVPPLSGHVYPALSVARALAAAGHRVTFVTHVKYRPLAESVSAVLVPTTVPYDALSDGFVTDPVVGPILSVIMAGNAEISADLDDLVRHFQRDRVDVICVGYASQIGFPLADRLAVPRVTLYSTYAWNKQVENDIYGNFGSREELTAAITRRNQLAEDLGFCAHAVPFGPASSVNLVAIPQFFQYYPECFGDDYVFMGPSIDAHPGVGPWKPKFRDRPLLYVSLGTTYNDNVEFFRSCIEWFGGGEFEVAMSVGNRVAIEELGRVPVNVEVRRTFPQISVLNNATVFLSHAGMGSTMEALLAQVPVVAVPQQGDQRLNARKIQELGLGADCSSTGPLDMATVAHAVKHVLVDSTFGDRLRLRSAEIRASNGVLAGIQAIESLC
ncbi:oleandomycin glycosyltransferase [Mycobacteroides abscessus subsp. bolletii]|uniref:nucleotide disphospho-sugar-binding domain-containing protein n=1 Tax=Mycobacteroides abscessus TaxID=36809 RepID=UPI000929A18E|nr:nucleotide disphospho-sugar-binding domain-containing protein [Mycobacteroides abscessus]SIJ05831.1 oleandomycin glycosyltransferase [Mycobacteroides abscessus subsp. bolletii]SLD78422.1 oleandomycin glycosyltransferase [Mycobacteroides abscessus subsp. bolletii]SLD85826.1 oleandomycin glycosyltransferase [Mycobacteroides abscessus subsp. bolletii]